MQREASSRFFAGRLEAVQHALNAAFAEAIARAQAKGLITTHLMIIF